MNKYEATGVVTNIDWEGQEDWGESFGGQGPVAVSAHPVYLAIRMSAADFAGLDLTKPITITQ